MRGAPCSAACQLAGRHRAAQGRAALGGRHRGKVGTCAHAESVPKSAPSETVTQGRAWPVPCKEARALRVALRTAARCEPPVQWACWVRAGARGSLQAAPALLWARQGMDGPDSNAPLHRRRGAVARPCWFSGAAGKLAAAHVMPVSNLTHGCHCTCCNTECGVPFTCVFVGRAACGMPSRARALGWRRRRPP